MCSPFNSPPTQHHSPVPSPVPYAPMLHSTSFTITQDKTPLNHQYSFQQEYSFAQKQAPGVENASNNGERTNSCNWGKKRFVTIKLKICLTNFWGQGSLHTESLNIFIGSLNIFKLPCWDKHLCSV